MRILIVCLLCIPFFSSGQNLFIKDTIIGSEKYEAIKYLDNGLVEVGQTKNNLESGLWEQYNLNGEVIYKGMYKKGLKEGLWIHPNGLGCGTMYKKGEIKSWTKYVKPL